MKAIKYWFVTWLRGGPHFIIGPNYLRRWFVLPRNPYLNIYLHHFLHDDEDRALHDHPWWFISIMLWGGYYEHMPKGGLTRRASGSIAYRPATHTHRVELLRKSDGSIRSCWTIVITGRVTRDWGFHCPQGWRHWCDFTAANDKGQVGKGCD